MPDKNLKDEPNRNPPPLVNPFRKFVTEELTRRKNDIPVPMTAPFVRLTSCLEEPDLKYKYFTMGLNGYNFMDEVFSLSYGQEREIVGYAYKNGQKTLIDASQLTARSFSNLTQDEESVVTSGIEEFAAAQKELQNIKNSGILGAYPIPGITEAKITRYSMSTGIKATVAWTCYGRQQMEFLRHQFMSVGVTVVLEWGQNLTSFQPKDILDFSDPDIDSILVRCFKEGVKYIVPNYVEPNQGNYNFIVGTVSNFTIALDADSNRYTVVTEIISTGEMLWGLSNTKTLIDLEDDSNNAQSFADYFKNGGNFDTLMSTVSDASNADVTIPYMKFDAETAKTVPEFANLSAYPDDWRFISWKFFAKDLMKDMVKFFSGNKQIQELISDFLKFYDNSVDIEVGNNPYLMSTDPDKMIIVRKNYKGTADVTVPDEFKGNGFFDEGTDQDRGTLNRGIWLNSHMVRDAFLTTPTLQDAITQILNGMNDASGDYWDLFLYYDEDTTGYRVVDRKFGNLKKGALNTTGNPMYVFNWGTRSELLGLEFDAVFPPGVVFQLALTARLMQNPELFAENLKKYPLLGQTSHYAFGMNWTHYEDVIQKKIQASSESKPEEEPSASSTDVGTIPFGKQQGEVRVGSRVSNTNATDASLEKSNKTAAPTMAADAATLPDATATKGVAIPDRIPTIGPGPAPARSSSTLLAPKSAHDTIASFITPTNYTRISSRFGDRTRPIAGASREHPGVDYAAPLGTPVYAAGDGTITMAGPNKGLGNFIEIAHSNGVTTRYGHMSALLVKAGDHVTQGQIIGKVGSTGISTGPHLHYEIRISGQVIDPLNIPPAAPPETPPDDVISSQPNKAADSNETAKKTEADANAERRSEVAQKFGDSIASMINVNESEMTKNIINDGLDNHEKKISNNFVAPFPTTVKVQISIQGIGGISYWDGFLVDKLPYIYENYGIFHTLGITDIISHKTGWTTVLDGTYRFMYFDGSLNDNVITTKNQISSNIAESVASLPLGI